jgi:hypothetical protein
MVLLFDDGRIPAVSTTANISEAGFSRLRRDRYPESLRLLHGHSRRTIVQ